MQLRHLNTVTQPATGESGDDVKMSKVMAVAWAPNNRKLAVCTVRDTTNDDRSRRRSEGLWRRCGKIKPPSHVLCAHNLPFE